MTCGICGIVVALISIHPDIPAHAGGLTPGERIGLAFRASACTAVAVPAAISSLPGLLGDRPVAGSQDMAVPRARPAGIPGHDPDCSQPLPDMAPAATGAVGTPGEPTGAPSGPADGASGDPYRGWFEGGEIVWGAGDAADDPAGAQGAY